MPTAPGVPPIQIFGRRDSRPTQKALRFFKERRIPVSFVDLAVRPLAPGELRRFLERLGTATLLDTGSRRYRELGLSYYRLDDAAIQQRLLDDPELLRLPLVRRGQACSAGLDEAAWRGWLGTGAPGGAVSTVGRQPKRASGR